MQPSRRNFGMHSIERLQKDLIYIFNLILIRGCLNNKPGDLIQRVLHLKFEDMLAALILKGFISEIRRRPT